MEKQEHIKSPLEKIRDCLQDYSNDFMALNLIFEGGGIKGIKKLINNGFKVLTVEEYLEKYELNGRETISVEEKNNPVFIEKAKELNELANKINSLGEKIDELELKKAIEKVKKIINFK